MPRVPWSTRGWDPDVKTAFIISGKAQIDLYKIWQSIVPLHLGSHFEYFSSICLTSVCVATEGGGEFILLLLIYRAEIKKKRRYQFNRQKQEGFDFMFQQTTVYFNNAVHVMWDPRRCQSQEQWQKNPEQQIKNSNELSQQSCSHSVYFSVILGSWRLPCQQLKATEGFQIAVNERYINYS